MSGDPHPVAGNEVSFLLAKGDRKQQGYKLLLCYDPQCIAFVTIVKLEDS